MVVKKVAVARDAPARSKALHIGDLCDYIEGAGEGPDGEKVEYRGAVNLLSGSHEEQVQEIVDLAAVARRCPQPVQHWIFSWREGEQPTAAQADEVVRIFLAEMGLAAHQGLYALHRDTDNWHLHLAVNRVHSETEKVVTVNRGFDLDVAHGALARIEHAQGWTRERQGRYQIAADGAVERAATIGNRTRQPRGRVREGEIRVGEKSAQRTAIEERAPILRKARTWGDLHRGLAGRGMRLERKGSGAVLWVGQTAVKASVAGRECSMAALEKRLGDYARPPVSLDVVGREPQALREEALGWTLYKEERRQHRADRAAAQARLRLKHTAELRAMRRDHRLARSRILGRDWAGKGQLLNAMRSLLAAGHRDRRADLQEQQRRERGALRDHFRAFPGFEEWLRRRAGPELAQRWRHGDELPPVRRVPVKPVQTAGQPGNGDRERAARESYERHLADVLRAPGAARRDASRIDLEIAVRMRVTGHRRFEIQQSIEERAPKLRPGESRDWNEYARRTVAAAFGVPGDRQIERLANADTRWMRVEGRSADERRPRPDGPEEDRDR